VAVQGTLTSISRGAIRTLKVSGSVEAAGWSSIFHENVMMTGVMRLSCAWGECAIALETASP